MSFPRQLPQIGYVEIAKTIYYLFTHSRRKNLSQPIDEISASKPVVETKAVNAQVPHSLFWTKLANKSLNKLTIDDIYFLANTKFAFRHVTKKEMFFQNLKGDGDGYFRGDAIPLHTVFDQLENKKPNILGILNKGS